MSREKTVELPSHRVVTLRWAKEPRVTPKHSIAAARAALEEGALEVVEDAHLVDPKTLKVGEFHAVRAIATKLGWLEEEMIDVDCRNCGGELTVAPCDAMPLGPFEERALRDDELDEAFAFGEAHDIGPITLSRGAVAKTVVLRDLTLEEVRPLHEAVAKGALRMTAAIVRAMGIVRLGDETAAPVIAKALDEASDESWGSVTGLFLQAHYSLRLFGIFACDACGARNDVDAPYEREFVVDPDLANATPQTDDKARTFCSLEEFTSAAADAAARLVPDRLRERIVVDVQGGVPEVDDGGESLLGSYVPEFEGSMAEPARVAQITVFYATFASVWLEEGDFDWRGELDETIEHELEHHLAFERGFDPTDAQERAEIDREAERIHGKRAIRVAELHTLGRSFGRFMRQTWPIWLFLAVVTVIAIVGAKNSD